MVNKIGKPMKFNKTLIFVTEKSKEPHIYRLMMKSSFFLSVLLVTPLLKASVCISSSEPVGTEEPFIHIKNPTPDNLPTYTGTCENLVPITSFEHLLKQIISHLDDECLFTMPMEKLSKKLGIDVIQAGEQWELLENKPLTNFNSGIIITKYVDNSTSTIKSLSIKEYARKRQSNERNDAYIRYQIQFTEAYLKKYGYPYFKNPADIPKPNYLSGSGCWCKGFDKHNFSYGTPKERGNKLPSPRVLHWNGYTGSTLFFDNCSSGAYNFYFGKIFYFK